MDQRAIPVTAQATPQKPPPRRGLPACHRGVLCSHAGQLSV